MGWKGTVRSINAEIKRQARESEKRQRQYLKEAEKEDARETVRRKEGYFNELLSGPRWTGMVLVEARPLS